MKQVSLKKRLVLAILLLTIMALTITVGSIYFILRQYLYHNVLNQKAMQNLYMIDTFISEHLQRYEAMLEVYANSDIIMDLDEHHENIQAVKNLFKSICRKKSEHFKYVCWVPAIAPGRFAYIGSRSA